MATQVANGTRRVLSLNVIGMRPTVSKDGKYYFSTEPVPENPNGIWGRTPNQVREIAIGCGLTSASALPRAIARGGCVMNVVVEFCKAGEASPSDPTVVYGDKDWWKVEAVSLELSESAQKYLDSITTTIDVEEERAALAADKDKAYKLRMALLMGGGFNGSTGDGNTDADGNADADGEPEEVLAEPVAKPAKRVK